MSVTLTTDNWQLTTDLAQRGPKAPLFITFEGSEGCGKSTQIASLEKYLRQKHNEREVVVLREPGGTSFGEKIRHLLKHEDPGVSITAEAELLLFAASRAQLVREIIRPALQRGAIVLCDRFLDSTIAYQGAARALNLEDVTMINRFATGGLLPDVTILLDLEVAVGRARMLERNKKSTTLDRMEQEPEAFYEAVRHSYLKLAATEPERWSVIDASQRSAQVTQQIILQLGKKWSI
ncbi:MAG: dTMP kinase [Chthoniobacterales bacterium]